MRKITKAAFSAGLAALLVMACGGTSVAGLITYTETLTGSGTLGSTQFTDAQITFTGTADTANVTDVGGYYSVLLMSPTVKISGLGTFQITGPLLQFDNQNTTELGVTELANGGTFSLQNSTIFSTYDLLTPTGATGASHNGGGIFATSSGSLQFSDLNDGGTGIFKANAVPEPSSLLLSCAGATVLWLGNRLRRPRK